MDNKRINIIIFKTMKEKKIPQARSRFCAGITLWLTKKLSVPVPGRANRCKRKYIKTGGSPVEST